MKSWFDEMGTALKASKVASDKASEAFQNLQKAYDTHNLADIKKYHEQYQYWLNESLNWLEV